MISFIIKIALAVLVVSYVVRLFQSGARGRVGDSGDSAKKRIHTEGLDIKDAKSIWFLVWRRPRANKPDSN